MTRIDDLEIQEQMDPVAARAKVLELYDACDTPHAGVDKLRTDAPFMLTSDLIGFLAYPVKLAEQLCIRPGAARSDLDEARERDELYLAAAIVLLGNEIDARIPPRSS